MRIRKISCRNEAEISNFESPDRVVCTIFELSESSTTPGFKETFITL